MKELMGKIIGFIVCAALLTGAFLVQAAERKDAYTARDEGDVLQLESEWSKAIQTGDTAAMERLLAPDYVGVDPAGASMGKSQEIDMFRKGDLKIESIQAGEQKIKVYIGGVIVTGKSTIKAKFKDQDISGDYRFIDVFERKPSGWQVVYSQLTKVESEDDKKKAKAAASREKPAEAQK
jgi:ketosteroid isomerase-like protein